MWQVLPERVEQEEGRAGQGRKGLRGFSGSTEPFLTFRGRKGRFRGSEGG
jgi:hypothetical protein